MSDEIFIKELELFCRIGVTPEERAQPQRLLLDITMESMRWFSAIEDRLENTVDYYAVCMRITEWIASQEFKLLETLAEEIAKLVLREFSVYKINLELKKFIVPNTNCVGVRIERSA